MNSANHSKEMLQLEKLPFWYHTFVIAVLFLPYVLN